MDAYDLFNGCMEAHHHPCFWYHQRIHKFNSYDALTHANLSGYFGWKLLDAHNLLAFFLHGMIPF